MDLLNGYFYVDTFRCLPYRDVKNLSQLRLDPVDAFLLSHQWRHLEITPADPGNSDSDFQIRCLQQKPGSDHLEVMPKELFHTPQDIQFDSVYCNEWLTRFERRGPAYHQLPTFYEERYFAKEDQVVGITVSTTALQDLLERCVTPGFKLTLLSLGTFSDVLVSCLEPVKYLIGSLNVTTQKSEKLDQMMLHFLNADNTEESYRSAIDTVHTSYTPAKDNTRNIEQGYRALIAAGMAKTISVEQMIEPEAFFDNARMFKLHADDPQRQDIVQCYTYRLLRFDLKGMMEYCNELGLHAKYTDYDYIQMYEGAQSNMFIQFLNERRVILRVGGRDYFPVDEEDPRFLLDDHSREHRPRRRVCVHAARVPRPQQTLFSLSMP